MSTKENHTVKEQKEHTLIMVNFSLLNSLIGKRLIFFRIFTQHMNTSISQ